MLRSVLFLGLLFALTGVLVKFILRLDLNKHIHNHYPGPCKVLNNIEHGSEDIAMVDPYDLAFISNGLFYLEERWEEPVYGSIYVFDFTKPDSAPKNLTIKGLPDPSLFRPHGLSHVMLPNGTVRLFAVVHSPPDFTHSVVVLDYERNQPSILTHVRTIHDEKLVKPNGIVGVGPEQFIFTNDGAESTRTGMLLAGLLNTATGSVVYYDGNETHYLLENSRTPNGVALSKDHKYLYVAHVMEKQLRVYNISDDYLEMDLIRAVDLGTMVDNLYVAEDGAIWIGSHPVLYKVTQHMENYVDKEIKAPSQVLRVEFTKSDFSEYRTTEVFADDGNLITASAAAVAHKGYLLIGSVWRETVICKVVDNSLL